MRIVYLIGNGFDINLDIKTRYPDFYEYYRSIHCEDNRVNDLKQEIAGDFDNWSDMEYAFGKYTERIKNQEELTKIVIDIGKNLGEYLEKQEKKFDFESVDKEKLFNHLSFPEELLLQADRNQISSFKNNFKSSHWIVDIVTFNYTRVLEKILGDDYQNIQIGTHQNNATIKLTGIQHIHGFTDQRMIFGVNDTSQISNSSFHENQDALEMIVKNHCNKANRYTIDSMVENQIKSANLICVFGSSIGKTDKIWWELIGEQLKKDVRLIIFEKDKPIDPRFEQMKLGVERKITTRFLSQTALSEEERDKIRRKIFIGLNSDMFQNMINERPVTNKELS